MNMKPPLKSSLMTFTDSAPKSDFPQLQPVSRDIPNILMKTWATLTLASLANQKVDP